MQGRIIYFISYEKRTVEQATEERSSNPDFGWVVRIEVYNSERLLARTQFDYKV